MKSIGFNKKQHYKQIANVYFVCSVITIFHKKQSKNN